MILGDFNADVYVSRAPAAFHACAFSLLPRERILIHANSRETLLTDCIIVVEKDKGGYIVDG